MPAYIISIYSLKVKYKTVNYSHVSTIFPGCKFVCYFLERMLIFKAQFIRYSCAYEADSIYGRVYCKANDFALCIANEGVGKVHYGQGKNKIYDIQNVGKNVFNTVHKDRGNGSCKYHRYNYDSRGDKALCRIFADKTCLYSVSVTHTFVMESE